jgi:hypothetical protein
MGQRKAFKEKRLLQWRETALRHAGFEFSGKAALAARNALEAAAAAAAAGAAGAAGGASAGGGAPPDALVAWDMLKCRVCNSGDGEDSIILCDACQSGCPPPV